uniref:gluconokinase n=1 Tax=Pararhizobium sp. IMCC3301 TaxID=3067904 RepID=UPI002741B9AD|nr:gluconokinase [Pararhizobium sp. IMCC3301]
MARLFVVMGVAGCGKSSIGEALAEKLGGLYLDGDTYHPAQNVAKMSRGEPLTDDDRWPWLERFGREMHNRDGIVVGGCSALKRAYRECITKAAGERTCFVYLSGSRDLIRARMDARTGHFMPLSLLDSQFATLEPPGTDEDAVTVEIDAPVDAIVARAMAALKASGDERDFNDK